MTTRKMDGLASIGVDVNARSFFLQGPVDSDMLRTAWSSLAALGISKPVVVFIDSGGGDLSTAFSIYDLISNFENHVTTVCLGEVSSAATVIFAAGDVRLISENSFCMIHNGSVELSSDSSEETTERWLRHAKTYTEKMIALYAKQMNLPISKVRRLLQHDTLYIGEQAVAAGLADGIWKKT
jgi:ATP-dependent Clp protease protease subunit